MRILLVDTGRSRGATNVATWREQLGLIPEDDVALASWLAPAEILPVVDQMVFGPTLDWGRREPHRPAVGGSRRSPLPTRPSVAHLPRTHPRRITAAVRRRRHTLWQRLSAALPVDPFAQLRSTSRVGRAVRRRLGVTSDGVATDFAIAVARSREVLGLTRWADVVVPIDPKSRKAAWILARRVEGPDVMLDINSAKRVIRTRRG